MKKIIALALALIMALSMASVAFAATTYVGTVENNVADGDTVSGLEVAPGTKMVFPVVGTGVAEKPLAGYKVSYDFTKDGNKGASLVDSVKISKDKEDVEVTLKESFTATTEKELIGTITLSKKVDGVETKIVFGLDIDVCNNTFDLVGTKKASEATDTVSAKANTVQLMDEDGGYVNVLVSDELKGTVKMGKEEKVFFNTLTYGTKTDAGYETKEAIDEYLGEDYEAIVEYYIFETRAFNEAVDFRYDAYEEDPHFFYAWDGEKLTQIESKYDDDEEVDDYVFSAIVDGAIIVTDVEIVAAEEETKNPDTGANDVVGVAAALAVVSLVAAGAVSLKK